MRGESGRTRELPRVLVVVSYGFSVRYLLPTKLLDMLGEVVHPVVGLGWDDPRLEALLDDGSHERLRLPDASLDHRCRMHRRRLGVVHRRRLDSPTSRMQRDRRTSGRGLSKSAAIGMARDLSDRVIVGAPRGAARVESAEQAMVVAGTNVAEFRTALVANRIDAVVSLTPYHDQDALVLWAARDLGLPSLTAVISFDNPTTRDRMSVRSDRVLVWNRYNADELLRSYPDLAPGRLRVVGAPQFDLHRRADLVMGEDEWRRRLGIPTGRPVVLYGAGPSELLPGEDRLVQWLDTAIAQGRIEGRPVLLVRRHPNDPPDSWQALAARLSSSIVADPWAAGSGAFRSWPSDDDVRMQMSTLAHSDVHVNVCSSMTLDGAMFDRPQVGPTFLPGAPERLQKQIRDYYRQEHWWPIARSGGVDNPQDEAALVESVNAALVDPGRRSAGRRRLVADVLTFDDGRSGERLVAEVADLLGSAGRDRDRSSS